MKKQRGNLFVISGPSGTGKGTICKRILQDSAPEDMTVSISMTTRAPRVGEVDGESYYFTTVEQFKKTVEAGGLLEYAEVYGNYYGTPKAQVLEKLAAGTDVILEIDIQGALQVKKAFPEGILLFILPPSLAELRNRITLRGTDSQETIDRRMAETLNEIAYLKEYDYYVVNDDLEEAVLATKSIISAEGSRVNENIEGMIAMYKEEN